MSISKTKWLAMQAQNLYNAGEISEEELDLRLEHASSLGDEVYYVVDERDIPVMYVEKPMPEDNTKDEWFARHWTFLVLVTAYYFISSAAAFLGSLTCLVLAAVKWNGDYLWAMIFFYILAEVMGMKYDKYHGVMKRVSGS